MAQSSDLRRKLEAAVRSSQQAKTKSKVEVVTPKPMAPQAPTIKLKKDFSHFSA